jgi:hypothetical protein
LVVLGIKRRTDEQPLLKLAGPRAMEGFMWTEVRT